VIALALLFAQTVVASAQQSVERPPQFIVLAFDNCTELERWQELTDFAADMNRNGDILNFTFFISGVNFIADVSRKVYAGPHRPRGASRINFGGSPEQVRRRVEYVNALHANGHEIGSHAVGHFNGAAWSAADWDKEFRSFSDILRNVGPNNGLPDTKLAVTPKDVIGFRAPYLAKSAGLYAVRKRNAFRYDTSGVSRSDAWPERIDGVWRFNLAMLRIAGSGRGTLSMDYNFLASGAIRGR
jgi:peptidoglycan/xylan/chitin deacetylase (PgdA/CDA1 family)